MDAKKTLYEKIQDVSMEIMGLEKDITVGAGSYGYKAISDESVLLAVKTSEAKHRILSMPNKQELVSSEIVRSAPDSSGNVKTTYVDTIKLTTRIIDLDSISDFVEIESFGRGVDNSDKGLGKASTYARKYALLNAYKIATGVDPDRYKSENIAEGEKVDVIKLQVHNYLLGDDNTREKTLQHFNCSSVDELTSEQVSTIYNSAKSKGRL